MEFVGGSENQRADLDARSATWMAPQPRMDIEFEVSAVPRCSVVGRFNTTLVITPKLRRLITYAIASEHFPVRSGSEPVVEMLDVARGVVLHVKRLGSGGKKVAQLKITCWPGSVYMLC